MEISKMLQARRFEPIEVVSVQRDTVTIGKIGVEIKAVHRVSIAGQNEEFEVGAPAVSACRNTPLPAAPLHRSSVPHNRRKT